MIVRLTLLLVGLFASAEAATCSCPKSDQQINADNPMLLFQNPTSTGDQAGTVCAGPCTLNGRSSGPNNGLKLRIVRNGLSAGNSFELFDGGADIRKIGPSDGTLEYFSSSANLTLKYAGTAADFFLITMEFLQDPVTTTKRPVVTTAAPTPPYHGPFDTNPITISNDIFISIDTSGQAADVITLKSLASAFVGNLRVVPEATGTDGTRLVLHSLSAFDGFSPIYSQLWKETVKSFQSTIANTVQPTHGDHSQIAPLEGDSGFLSKAFALGRPNTALYYIMFTSTLPKELGDTLKDQFEKYGVHPIVVTNSLTKKDMDDYFNKDTLYKGVSAWTWVRYEDFGKEDAVVKELIDNVFGDVKKTSCEPSEHDLVFDSSLIDPATGKQKKTISIPAYYNGPITVAQADQPAQGATPKTVWEKASNHYCNFQKTVINLKYQNDTTDQGPFVRPYYTMCLTVFYELEDGADTVTIYDEDTRIVTLTGLDVSGAKFKLRGYNGRIEFNSDNKGVYDGFYAEVVRCKEDAT